MWGSVELHVLIIYWPQVLYFCNSSTVFLLCFDYQKERYLFLDTLMLTKLMLIFICNLNIYIYIYIISIFNNLNKFATDNDQHNKTGDAHLFLHFTWPGWRDWEGQGMECLCILDQCCEKIVCYDANTRRSWLRRREYGHSIQLSFNCLVQLMLL